MPGRRQEEGNARIVSKSYRINVSLFVILAVSTMLWVNRHLQPYLIKTTLIGGTLTLWGIWKLIQSWVKWGLESAEISLARRILDRQASTEVLVLGLVVLAVLFFSTSSVYLVYEGDKKGEAEYTVEVTHDDKPYLEPITIASYNRVKGRPLFLRISGVHLQFDITTPRGFQPLERDFGPGSSIHLRVPLDFKRKELHLLRLVPGLTIWNELPKIRAEPQVEYCLRVARNGEEYLIEDLRSQTIYIGADSADIAVMVASADAAAFRSAFGAYLRQLPVAGGWGDYTVARWEGGVRIVSTPEFKRGDKIELEVAEVGSGSVLAKESIHMTSGDGIKTIFLEKKR